MSKTTATIQMYRMRELGDCFLLRFQSGAQHSHMLIDCGTFRNDKSKSIPHIHAIVAEIAAQLGGQPLDIVVGTHQHNDHLNGFVHAQAAFRQIGIGQVWLSWLDDPQDPVAREIGQAHGNLLEQLARARDIMAGDTRGRYTRPAALRARKVLGDVLGFYGAHELGAVPKTPAAAVRILKQIGRQPPQYLRPGRTLEMPGLPPGTVKIHVLGPPRDAKLLYRDDPRDGESYDHELALAGAQAARLFDALHPSESSEETHYPFAAHHKKKPWSASAPLRKAIARYHRRPDKWRTIDDDWLLQAESLALYMHGYTNNSSLALAIELVESGKVLLFAADAQTGNWLSWDAVRWEQPGLTTDDLLARTIFYKAGHHGSHNSTLVAAFEKMTHPHLASFIPVDGTDSNIARPGGWKMPAARLYTRIREKTHGRVLRMDGADPADCDPTQNPAKKAWAKAKLKPDTSHPLLVQVEIPG